MAEDMMGKLQASIAILFVWGIMAVGYHNMANGYEAKILDLNAEIEKMTDLEMTVTAYNPTKSQCDGDPNITAFMKKSIPGRTAEVSRDKLYMAGRKVYVEGYGVWEVSGVTSKDLVNTIDLMVGSEKTAMKIGNSKRRVVLI